MTTAAHQSIASPQRGFESLEEETRIDGLPVQGQLPPWLTGSLLRTGPAKWEVGGRSMNHWFDGLAMLHRFSFGDGAVSYANRFLQTSAWRAAHDTGKIAYSEFATDPCRSLFQRVSAMFSPRDQRQRERQSGAARRALHRDDRDADSRPVRRRHVGRRRRRVQGPRGCSRPRIHTWTARPRACSTMRPSSGPATATGSSG